MKRLISVIGFIGIAVATPGVNAQTVLMQCTGSGAAMSCTPVNTTPSTPVSTTPASPTSALTTPTSTAPAFPGSETTVPNPTAPVATVGTGNLLPPGPQLIDVLPGQAPVIVAPGSASAFSPTNPTEGMFKARNLARAAAERVNGGVERYRADASMYGGKGRQMMLDSGTHWIFTVYGGIPGQPASRETMVRISKTNYEIAVVYNGPIRS
jgi:hypothetical protein